MSATSANFRILEELERHFERYAALPPGLPLVLALWSLATHLFDIFDAFPYLAITSPTKRCGKTRVAELLELVCAKPRRTVGISPAALFRLTEKEQPTWIADEAESLRGKGERTDALREILNAGYKKGQKVIRCTGDSYTPRGFETFCPKVLVLIGTLPETLADRCIAIAMKRRTSENLERFRHAHAQTQTKTLAVLLKQWAKKNRRAVGRWYQSNDIKCLRDREAELWLPLFAVCAVAAPERLAELESVALGLAGVKAASEPGDLGIRLLADVRDVFDEVGADRLSTEVLLSKLNQHAESPWPGWNHGKGLSAHNLGRMLSPFGISPGTVRFSDGQTAKGYYRDSFTEAWQCYLPPPEKRHTGTTQINTGENGDSASVTKHACDGTEDSVSANVHAGCDGVTDQELG